MNRLLFEKTGKAIYISHLDTMAMFPRIFLRANLRVKFTQGMSPHAYVSIALPMSVGMSSQCEILDFALEESEAIPEELPDRLNRYFPSGLRVREAYESDRKIKELRYLRCAVTLEYDNGVSDIAKDQLSMLFQQDEILIKKKTKKGLIDTDIRSLIKEISVERINSQELCLNTIISAQNPSLNPNYLIDAIKKYYPKCCPDFAHTHRVDVFDEDLKVFR